MRCVILAHFFLPSRASTPHTHFTHFGCCNRCFWIKICVLSGSPFRLFSLSISSTVPSSLSSSFSLLSLSSFSRFLICFLFLHVPHSNVCYGWRSCALHLRTDSCAAAKWTWETICILYCHDLHIVRLMWEMWRSQHFGCSFWAAFSPYEKRARCTSKGVAKSFVQPTEIK